MDLTDGQQEVADRLAVLLAESPLDEEIKVTLLDNLDKMPDYIVMDLLASLEKERDELKHFAHDLAKFIDRQETDWSKLAQEQEGAADRILDQATAQLEV